MQSLVSAIPDVDLFLSLSPEELASKLIFLLKVEASRSSNGSIHGGNLANQFGGGFVGSGNRTLYPDDKLDEVKQAFFEAWAWLESQGLLVQSPGDGHNGWRRLSRRAQNFSDQKAFLSFSASKDLRPEMLHVSIAIPVWQAFSRSEFDVAIFLSMKAVEVAVRTAGSYPTNLYGVKLMREAFNYERGPLTDLSLDQPEREALLALFSGAIGWFKNPQSHKNVGVSDAREAIETILFANRLLNIVDDIVRAKSLHSI